jgi:hypothetical protein
MRQSSDKKIVGDSDNVTKGFNVMVHGVRIQYQSYITFSVS